jgi:hypothetical protein
VKITVGASTSLNKIWLSWVAFSPTTASFGSYGGQVSQSKYTGSISSDISNSLYQNAYSLYGLNLISLTSSTPLDFTSQIDNNFVLTISSSSLIDNFALIYVTFGVLPGKLCDDCGDGLVANGAECVSACPVGTYSFSYKDGGVACRTCSSKLGLILTSGKCVAATTTTYTVTTTTTVSAKLPPATKTDSTTTQSSTKNDHTATQSSTKSNQATQTTQSTTQSTQAVQTSTSTQSTQTVPSPAPTVFKPVCPPNAHFIENGGCSCNVGYVYKNEQCQAISVQIPTTPIPVPTITSNSTKNPDQTPKPTPSPAPARPPTSSCGANSYDNGLSICVC